MSPLMREKEEKKKKPKKLYDTSYDHVLGREEAFGLQRRGGGGGGGENVSSGKGTRSLWGLLSRRPNAAQRSSMVVETETVRHHDPAAREVKWWQQRFFLRGAAAVADSDGKSKSRGSNKTGSASATSSSDSSSDGLTEMVGGMEVDEGMVVRDERTGMRFLNKSFVGVDV